LSRYPVGKFVRFDWTRRQSDDFAGQEGGDGASVIGGRAGWFGTSAFQFLKFALEFRLAAAEAPGVNSEDDPSQAVSEIKEPDAQASLLPEVTSDQ
jgi:hypothetical protein